MCNTFLFYHFITVDCTAAIALNLAFKRNSQPTSALWTQSPRHNMISLFPSHLPFLLLCLVLMILLIGSNCNELGLEMQIHWCLNLLTHFLRNYKYKIGKDKEYQIQITQYQIKMKNTEFKIQNTKHKIQSTENKL